MGALLQDRLADWPSVVISDSDSDSAFISEVKSEVRKQDQNTTERGSDSALNQRAFESEAELRRKGFVIQKELSVWTVITECYCNSDVK
jgi:hypothetical protein